MKTVGRIALGLLVATLGVATAFRPTLASRFEHVQVDPGDTLLNHYLLEHSFRSMFDTTNSASLWSPRFFYPQPLVLGYSENLLGVAPVYWLLRTVLPMGEAFSVWMMLMTFANFLAAWRVLSWLKVRDEPLPFLWQMLGAFLFAFAMPHQAQICHQQLLARFWMPFAIYFAARFLQSPRTLDLNRVVGLTVLQAITCVNTGWFLGFGIIVLFAVSCIVEPAVRSRLWDYLRHHWRGWLPTLVVWGSIAAVFFWPYFQANQGRTRDYDECVPYLPTLSAWFANPQGARWYETIKPYREFVNIEQMLFSGFGFYLLLGLSCVWAFARRNRACPTARMVRLGIYTTLALVLLTMNFGDGISPWYLVRYIPGGLAIRAVGRVSMAVELFAIPAMLVSVASWLHDLRLKNQWKTAMAIIAVLGISFEQIGSDPPSFSQRAYFDKVRKLAHELHGASVAYVEIEPNTDAEEPADPMATDLIAMWAGLEANVPVVNGYSGRSPNNFPRNHRFKTDDELKAWLAPANADRVRIMTRTTNGWHSRDLILRP